MTTNCTMTAIRPLPAGDYCEPEHAVRTDAGILVITGIRGKTIDWHVLATVDPESDAVLSLALHALDHGQPNEPYRTNATIDGAAYIYDPEAKSGFTVRDPLAYEAAVRVFRRALRTKLRPNRTDDDMDESNYEKPYIKNGNSVTAQVDRCRFIDFGWIQLDLVGTEPSGMRCSHRIDLPPEFGLEPFQRGRTVCVTKTHDNFGCTFKVEFENTPPKEVFCEY